MIHRILITGSSGLIGTALTSALSSRGVEVLGLDLRARGEASGDVLDRLRLQAAISRVDGIIHLAAVSRVISAERDPDRCWATNVGGLRNVLEFVETTPAPSPWVVFASSREVYGQPANLPAVEDCPLCPVNVYGRSKVEGERLILDARGAGVRACTIRLSNVFGSTADHADRVVPAFARAAALGRELCVEGPDHTFDFTHVDDVARGIVALTDLLEAGEVAPPPIHFVSGTPTTLGELARLAVELGQSGATIRTGLPRDFDVARFFGSPARAKALLGWQPQVRLEEGLSRLICAFRDLPRTEEVQEPLR